MLYLILSNHDLFNQIASTELDEFWPVERARDLSTSYK